MNVWLRTISLTRLHGGSVALEPRSANLWRVGQTNSPLNSSASVFPCEMHVHIMWLAVSSLSVHRWTNGHLCLGICLNILFLCTPNVWIVMFLCHSELLCISELLHSFSNAATAEKWQINWLWLTGSFGLFTDSISSGISRKFDNSVHVRII